MKLLAAFAMVASLLGAEGGRVHMRPGQNAFIQHIHQRRNASGLSGVEANRYGRSGCPCIGIDNIDGTTDMMYEGQKLSYPADVGARCKAWEGKAHPDCRGDKAPTWCQQAWCYVDPCECDLDVPPKPSAYMPGGEYQGHPVHYSYATCGGTDEWSTDEMKVKAQKADNKEMCATPIDAAHWGDEKCRCIGMEGQQGTVQVSYGNEAYTYPADMGSRCHTWEADVHPSCTKDGAPDWCHQKWCFVDPCSCNLDTPSKGSAYLPDAKHQGKPIHYSYATCGGVDSWSTDTMKEQAKENKDICSSSTSAPENHTELPDKSAALHFKMQFASAGMAIAAILY